MARVKVKVPVEEPNEPEAAKEVAAEGEEQEQAVSHQGEVQAPPPAAHRVVAIPKQLVYLLAVIVILLVALIVVSISRGDKGDNADSKQSSQQQSANDMATKYHDEVKDYLALPTDKPLEYADVKDAAKLKEKNPTVFKSAENGDVVLFYQNPDKSLQVVLYRPSIKKVITYIDGVNQNADPQSTTQQPKTNKN